MKRSTLAPDPSDLHTPGCSFCSRGLGSRSGLTAAGHRSGARPGYVLIAVLIVVVVLALAAYQFTELMTAEYRAAARTGDAAQAKHAAVSGVHYAAAMLADPSSFYGDLGGHPFADGAFQEQLVRQNDNAALQARFSLVAVAPTGDGTYSQRFGAVTDEAGKLNVNALIQLDPSGQMLYTALMSFAATNPNMTSDIADAIVDWVDADDDPRTGGAESSTYSAQGYKAKNGPLNTIDELLLVRGVTPQLLYGTDRNRNGVADDDPNGGQTTDNLRGLADFLTVYGRELNLDSAGVLRDNVNESEDLPGLYQRLTARVGTELADYILAYKMFGVSSPGTSSSGGAPSGNTGGSGGSGPAGGGSGGSGGRTTTGDGDADDTTTGGSSGRSGGTAGGSSGGSGGSGGNPPTTQQGSAADLNAAVQAALQGGNAANRRRIKSLLDLRNTQVTLPKAADAPQNAPTVIVPSPLNDPSRLPDLLATLYDKATTTTNVEMTPRINLNTAPREVLMALVAITAGGASGPGSTGSGMTTSGSPGSSGPGGGLAESDVDLIIGNRDSQNPSDPATQSGVWVIAAGMSPDTFKKIEQYVTGRTMVFRAQSIGYLGKGGPVARVEAVIDTNQGAPRFLYFRDLGDLDNPRGFGPPR